MIAIVNDWVHRAIRVGVVVFAVIWSARSTATEKPTISSYPSYVFSSFIHNQSYCCFRFFKLHYPNFSRGTCIIRLLYTIFQQKKGETTRVAGSGWRTVEGGKEREKQGFANKTSSFGRNNVGCVFSDIVVCAMFIRCIDVVLIAVMKVHLKRCMKFSSVMIIFAVVTVMWREWSVYQSGLMVQQPWMI